MLKGFTISFIGHFDVSITTKVLSASISSQSKIKKKKITVVAVALSLFDLTLTWNKLCEI